FANGRKSWPTSSLSLVSPDGLDHHSSRPSSSGSRASICSQASRVARWAWRVRARWPGPRGRCQRAWRPPGASVYVASGLRSQCELGFGIDAAFWENQSQGKFRHHADRNGSSMARSNFRWVLFNLLAAYLPSLYVLATLIKPDEPWTYL